jgi:hypothetical protein
LKWSILYRRRSRGRLRSTRPRDPFRGAGLPSRPTGPASAGLSFAPGSRPISLQPFRASFRTAARHGMGREGEFEWCPTLALAMPDEVFWPEQSHRGRVMRVAMQAQAGAKKKAESSQKDSKTNLRTAPREEGAQRLFFDQPIALCAQHPMSSGTSKHRLVRELPKKRRRTEVSVSLQGQPWCRRQAQ